MEQTGSETHLMICGLCSELPGHGAGVRSGRALLGLALESAPQGLIAQAHVRLMPDGEVNPAAARSISRMGLIPARVEHHQIIGNHRDLHLIASAEADGGSYRSLLFRGTVSRTANSKSAGSAEREEHD